MKNKFQFIDGSIEIPEEGDLNYIAWQRCNNIVHTWIIKSIIPSIAQSVVFIDNAVDMWNDLKDRFMRRDRICVAQLHQEISNLKQGNKKVSDYFTELRSLWEELDQYRLMPSCTCHIACACLAIRNSRSFRAEDRIIQFLIGLNEEFHGVVSQVLLMDPLPQINRVISMVMPQERKISGTLFTSNNTADEGACMVNAVDRSKKPYGRGIGNGNSYAGRGRGNLKVCTHCGKTGHIIDNCYRKHGYPPNFGNENSYANQVEVDESEKSVTASTSDSGGGNMSLTREQYHNLMMLLEKNAGSINIAKGGKSHIANFNARSSVNWILDT
ncbi:uncharacterized protein LOC131657147 [Vicia villosa]|uniref:uncharacterized protein LOC131657147 n=1 Tax=Vicia villosa TaxID=3911 RepID=UPI00273BC03D|nr:uncharacterized protein LOC131657147 [Vicia villosa]